MKKEGRQEKRTGIKMPKNLKFRGNKKAVSTVIGTLLVLAILVMVYSIIQVSQVPAWNKGVELEHMNVVYSDMMFLKSDIENAAMLETPKSSNIHMGVRYPDRMIFRNSGVGVAGQLKVEDDVKITVNYTNASGNPTTKQYNSSRIMYKASGTIASPELVYEHGVILKDFGNTNRTTDEQPLIAGDNIYIPVVNGTSNSRSSMGIESLEIYPYTETNTTTGIEYVNITMDTNYPEVWKELLDGVNTSETTATVSGNKIYINSSATRYIVFPNQTATGILYAGMITFSTELPPGVVLIIPTVTTQDASAVDENNATLNMTYDFKDYGSGEVRFAYKVSDSAWVSYTAWVSTNESGYYSKPITGLSNSTTYYFKAQLKYDSTVIEGTEKSFTTEGGLAGDLEVDTSGAWFTGSGKQLKGITLENTGTSDITIEYIRVSWSVDNGEKIVEILAPGQIWTGSNTSGAWLDVADVTLLPGDIKTVDFKFNLDMSEKDSITIEFLLNDSTIKSITYP